MEKGKKGLSWLVFLKLEKFKLDREHSRMIFDKGMLAYFIFLASAVVGLVTGYCNWTGFMFLVVLAFVILFVTSVPYLRSMANEKSALNHMINDFERPRS